MTLIQIVQDIQTNINKFMHEISHSDDLYEKITITVDVINERANLIMNSNSIPANGRIFEEAFITFINLTSDYSFYFNQKLKMLSNDYKTAYDEYFVINDL